MGRLAVRHRAGTSTVLQLYVCMPIMAHKLIIKLPRLEQVNTPVKVTLAILITLVIERQSITSTWLAIPRQLKPSATTTSPWVSIGNGRVPESACQVCFAQAEL
jgi:hypothetical protein